jgi:hypothetical protein
MKPAAKATWHGAVKVGRIFYRSPAEKRKRADGSGPIQWCRPVGNGCCVDPEGNLICHDNQAYPGLICDAVIDNMPTMR